MPAEAFRGKRGKNNRCTRANIERPDIRSMQPRGATDPRGLTGNFEPSSHSRQFDSVAQTIFKHALVHETYSSRLSQQRAKCRLEIRGKSRIGNRLDFNGLELTS